MTTRPVVGAAARAPRLTMRETVRRLTRVAVGAAIVMCASVLTLGVAGYRLTPPEAGSALHEVAYRIAPPEQEEGAMTPAALPPPVAVAPVPRDANGVPTILTSIDPEADSFEVVLGTERGPVRLAGMLWAEAGRSATALAVDDDGEYVVTPGVDSASGTRLASVTVYGAVSIRRAAEVADLPVAALSPDGRPVPVGGHL